MQTKKRAKSVKFGRTKEEPEETSAQEKKIVKEKEPETKEVEKKDSVQDAKKAEEIKEEKSVSDTSENEDEKISEDEDTLKSADDEEEKSPKDKEESEDDDDEPKDINLSEEHLEEAEPEKPSKHELLSVIETSPSEEPSSVGSFTKASEGAERKGNAWFFIMVTLIAFIIGLGCIAGIYYFTANEEETNHLTIPNMMAKPTPTPTEMPSPTPEKLDLSSYTIKVLNGSGTTGEAARLKSELTTAGFTVNKTGNADTSDYTKTVIEAKKGTDEAYMKELIAALKKSYAIDANIETLATSEDADVVVIIGSSPAK